MTAVGAPAVGVNQYGMETDLFTRGTGEARGESMVQKHMEKMQQDKENIAMQQLATLMPQLGAAVRVLALKEAVFDVETAVTILRSFQSQNEEAAHAIQKKRKKLVEAESEAVSKAEEENAAALAAEASSSSSSSSDSSDSDSDGDRKRKKRKRSEKKHSKRSKDKDSKKKKKKSEKERSKKRSKKDDSSKAKPTDAGNFGRFGILRETDAATKHAEFTLWAIEVKKANLELMSRPDEKELFKDYMEDYNTGTLPHRKYYNLEIYEREKAVKYAAKHGKKAELTKKQMVLNDEAALRRQREEERARLAEERLQRDLAELQKTGKAKDMREQELLRMQMQAAYKTGDKAKAEQIMKQLMTDDEKMAKGIMKWKPKV